MRNFSETNHLTQLHNFRDNYLETCPYGRYLIDNFYYLSNKIIGNLSISDATEAINLIESDVMPIINKLLNNPSSNQTVLFDIVSKNKLITFLDKMKLLSNDSTYQSIILELEESLNNEVGKAVNVISSDIRSR